MTVHFSRNECKSRRILVALFAGFVVGCAAFGVRASEGAELHGAKHDSIPEIARVDQIGSTSTIKIEFGMVDTSQKRLSRLVRIENVGDAPLVVGGFQNSCGCVSTTPIGPGQGESFALDPGEHEDVLVSLDLKQQIGDISRVSHVMLTNRDAPAAIIEIHADIVPVAQNK